MKLKTEKHYRKSMKYRTVSFKRSKKNLQTFWNIDKERKRRQKLLLSGKKGDITSDPEDIKRVIREYCGQLYTHRFGNLHKTD